MSAKIFKFVNDDDSGSDNDFIDELNSGEININPRHRVELEIDDEDDNNVDYLTPLSAAIIKGKDETFIEALLDAQVREKSGKDGNTPLHFAASLPEKDELIKILIRRGADPMQFNNNSKTSLQLAAEKGYFENVKALLKFCEKDECIDFIETALTSVEKRKRETKDRQWANDLKKTEELLRHYLRKSQHGGYKSKNKSKSKSKSKKKSKSKSKRRSKRRKHKKNGVTIKKKW